MENLQSLDNPLPIILLTGFLGSGKTTLLNALVQRPEMARTLVIINEFGDVGLDHLLVTHSADDTVVEMSSGCLCCTIRSDLVKTLKDITWRFGREGRRQFDRVMIETTGLADPAPILHTLMTNEFIATRYRLGGVVTTLDLAAGQNTLDSHPESIKQAAVADLLVLTKEDIAPAAVTTALKSRLEAINPAARQVITSYGELDPSILLNLGLFDTSGKSPDVQRWLNVEAYSQVPAAHSHSHNHNHNHNHKHNHEHDHYHNQDNHHEHDLNRHDDHIRAFCFQFDRPIDPWALEEWLSLIMPLLGHNMLRIKGILNLEGNERPLAIHGVQHLFHPPVQLDAWPDEDRRSKLVFITNGIDRSLIEATLKGLIPYAPAAGEARQ